MGRRLLARAAPARVREQRSSSISTSSRLAGPYSSPSEAHQQVAVEPQVLLDVLAHVRVIPVDAGVGEAKPVGELAAGRDRSLGEARDAVEAVVQPDAVPVHRGGLRQAIVKATVISEPRATSISGPGCCPLKANMV